MSSSLLRKPSIRTNEKEIMMYEEKIVTLALSISETDLVQQQATQEKIDRCLAEQMKLMDDPSAPITAQQLAAIKDQYAADLALISAKVKELTRENFERINIVIIGKTGVGKSTLINAIFGCKMAKEGVCDSKTMEITAYPRACDEMKGPYHYLRIFDTRGIELDSVQETVDKVKRFLTETNETSNDMRDHIHFALYTVLAGSMRLEAVEIKLIETICQQGIGVIIVMTKAIDDEENMDKFQKAIITHFPKIDVVRVLAKAIKARENTTKAFGLDELVKQMNKKIPGQCRSAFVAAQKVDRRLKGKRAEELVNWLMIGNAVVTALSLGALTRSYLSVVSPTIARVFEVNLPDAWMRVVTAAETQLHGFTSYLLRSIFIPKMSIARNYFKKLIKSLEQLHAEREGDMQSITIDDLVAAIMLQQ